MGGERQFCLTDYDVYGFDLDGCLAKYYWEKTFMHMYKYFTRHLIEKNGYSPNVHKPWKCVHHDIIFRGLIIDKEKGNLLKLDGEGNIVKAHHGSRRLSGETIKALYPNGLPTLCQALLQNFDHTEDFHVLDNYFEVTVGLIFANMVDTRDEMGDSTESYRKYWNDIVPIYKLFYTELPTGYGDNLFPYYCRSIADYVKPCSDKLKRWLKSLKQQNKTVFLMTSSYVAFSKVLLSHVLGEDYEDYFAFFLAKTGKPRWFHLDREFIKSECAGEAVESLESKCWYEEGSYTHFMPLLAKMTSMSNPKVLYFGDGIKNDVFPCKMTADWGTVLILEGMEVEGLEGHDKTSTPENGIVRDEERLHLGDNPHWGSFFADNGRESLSARVIRSCADLAIPWLDYIADLPLDQTYATFDDANASRTGYFPKLVTQLV